MHALSTVRPARTLVTGTSTTCNSCYRAVPMDTSRLDYDLPEHLIAQHPAEPRDASRLLVVDRSDQSIREDVFRNIGAYLRTGDCLVLNDTRVIRARLRARKPTGGHVELFLLRETAPGRWEALVRPSAKVKPGTQVELANGIAVEVGAQLDGGRRELRFDEPDVLNVLESTGEIPLPPYIERDHPEPTDAERYQTVFSRVPGAVAAPTAGLHYTEDVLRELDDRGIRRCSLTLHVGYGTFKPISVERLEEHAVDAEDFELSASAASMLNETRAAGRRVVAVGTTSTRVLETCFKSGGFEPGTGRTDLYIHPGYTFRAVDVLQTNFHLPRSSLLALVAAFAGVDLVLEAYRYAIAREFRFYSYGDAMLVL